MNDEHYTFRTYSGDPLTIASDGAHLRISSGVDGVNWSEHLSLDEATRLLEGLGHLVASMRDTTRPHVSRYPGWSPAGVGVPYARRDDRGRQVCPACGSSFVADERRLYARHFIAAFDKEAAE